MTENEYIIEMLCCTPLELLEKRLKGENEDIPIWLLGISLDLIKEAREKYYDSTYSKKRADMLRCI